MSGLFDGLRTGAWVTRERMRLVAFGLLIVAGLTEIVYRRTQSDSSYPVNS